jgi:TorA maturation chaperone TorD
MSGDSSVVVSLAPEDAARADFYALLSRLYIAAPDAALLQTLAAADAIDAESEQGAELVQAWQRLVLASGAMDAAAAEDEYQSLFVGVGKSEVSLYASAYAKTASGNTLADVREAISGLGLGRKTGSNLYEDHLAAILETMRMLISPPAGTEGFAFATQQEFFETHVCTWVFACCGAIQRCPIANYYRRVAEFTEKFMAIERDSFAVA